MIKNRTLIYIVICFFLVSLQDDENPNHILWEEDGLKWEHFQGTVPDKPEVLANSNISVRQFGKSEGAILNLKIIAYFNKDASWVVGNSQSAHLLNHEQGHFDIEEYSARCLREAVSTFKFASKNTVNFQLDSLYKVYDSVGDSLQSLYDEETELSVNKLNQEKWDEKIDSLLNTKAEYTETILPLNLGYLLKK